MPISQSENTNIGFWWEIVFPFTLVALIRFLHSSNCCLFAKHFLTFHFLYLVLLVSISGRLAPFRIKTWSIRSESTLWCMTSTQKDIHFSVFTIISELCGGIALERKKNRCRFREKSAYFVDVRTWFSCGAHTFWFNSKWDKFICRKLVLGVCRLLGHHMMWYDWIEHKRSHTTEHGWRSFRMTHSYQSIMCL